MGAQPARVSCLLLAAVLAACGDDETVTKSSDTIPPAAISDLTVGGPRAESISLLWTASGDDGTQGRSSGYDLRFATTPLTEANWENATKVSGEPEPDDPGFKDYCTVSGLNHATEYYFALKVSDEATNWSPLSNVAQGTTAPPPDIAGPAQVKDLRATTLSPFAVQLSWTAPGDDGDSGTAARYEIHYSSLPIRTATDWAGSPSVLSPPSPSIGGTEERYTVSPLVHNTAYFFALKAADEVPNWGVISNTATARTELAEGDPPAPVVDLRTGDLHHNSVELLWTASGDDGTEGVAALYDMRFYSSPINEGNWSGTFRVAGEPAPSRAGTGERFILHNLQGRTRYYVALKVGDEVPNWSPLSNLLDITTPEPPDVVPPATIGDLSIYATARNAITLRWLAPGDDGTSGRAAVYDIRFATFSFDESGWESAQQLLNEPAPAAPGSIEIVTVSELKPNTTYYFAVKTMDDAGNTSSISNRAQGQTSH